MSTRTDVAREAARLLYNRTVKEYKDAKEMAAASLGTRALPSNYEVAVELEHIVEIEEGSDRLTRLIEMRTNAAEIMKSIEELAPVLIGSVWRGTPREGSDIDIVVYSNDSETVADMLRDFKVTGTVHKEFIVGGMPRTSTHIELMVNGYDAEVVVRPPQDREHYRDERCDTYGDLKRGITLPDLEKLIQVDPLRRFIPKRRNR